MYPHTYKIFFFIYIERTLGHYVLAWKKDIAVLTAGDVKVTMNSRIRLIPSTQQQQQQKQQQQQQHQHHRPRIVDTNEPAAISPLSSLSSYSSYSNSYNLEIQNVRTNDAGEYACQIGSIVPKEIVHSLDILSMYPPVYTNFQSFSPIRHIIF